MAQPWQVMADATKPFPMHYKVIVNWTIFNKKSMIWIELNVIIFIKENVFDSVCKMAAIFFQPQ